GAETILSRDGSSCSAMFAAALFTECLSNNMRTRKTRPVTPAPARRRYGNKRLGRMFSRTAALGGGALLVRAHCMAAGDYVREYGWATRVDRNLIVRVLLQNRARNDS